MRWPRFRIRTLMVAVGAVAASLAVYSALVAHSRQEARAGMVLRHDYFISVEVSPTPRLVLLAALALAATGTLTAIIWVLRRK